MKLLCSTTMFLLGLMITAALSAAECSIGLLIDQPAVVVMKTESSILAEIAERIDRNAPEFKITIIHPTAEGTFVTRTGQSAKLESFDKLWIFQGDEYIDTTPLFSEKITSQLKAYIDRPGKGIFLLAGATPLLNQLGFGPVKVKPFTVMDDRYQTGIIPYQANAPLFKGTISERQTIWMSNAAYYLYTELKIANPNIVSFGTTHAPWCMPLSAGIIDDNGQKRVAVLDFPWAVHPVYYHAAEEFRHNFETLLRNLLLLTGSPYNPSDTTPPSFVLPDFAPLHRALTDIIETWGEEYPKGNEYLVALNALEQKAKTIKTKQEADVLQKEFDQLQKTALLANPTLGFNEVLFVRRAPGDNGFPYNYDGNSHLKATGYKNEIVRFNIHTETETPVYRPVKDEFVGDVELDWDANRILFSMPDSNKNFRWRVWELPISPEKPVPYLPENAVKNIKMLPLINDDDVDNYDACILPDNRIVFCSTACFTGVPCVDGSRHVCNLYLKENNDKIRQLTLEQDHDWCPTVLNNGRIMYLRWEYTDLPHAFSRILFHMNPDGTNQSELYGSGSYWPNAMFYARPIPDHPTKFVAIITGHHEQNRIGELVLFDPSNGRQEVEGVIQRIPGYGKKVSPVTLDFPITQSWPKFVHPYPLSEKYFIVSCKRNAQSPWTLCLVDVFDNIVTLKEDPNFSLFEPIPILKRERPPVIPDRIDTNKSTADVFIADIYEGEGLKGVPRGLVKAIRVFSYEFSYQGMGAEPHSVGLDGPWDPKRVLGTVPVYEDGSAAFTIPAYTPVALQPLDKEGKAIQLMRSWITAMPGESVSCIGCHEKQNSTSPTTARTIAAQSKPSTIKPFYGPDRGFSFNREIQPILDKYCLECHQPNSDRVKKIFTEKGLPVADQKLPVVPDFRTGPHKPLQDNTLSINQKALFSPSYVQLRRFVRTPTKESIMYVLKPYEYHADNTRLVQLLQEDHYGVQLDTASWDRLITWIDLNAPYYGNWGDIRNYEMAKHVQHQWQRRSDLRKLYTGHDIYLDDDPTKSFPVNVVDTKHKEDIRNRHWTDKTMPLASSIGTGPGFHTVSEVESVPLSSELDLNLVSIPGTNFKLGQFEITNEQYRLFDPNHHTGYEPSDFIHFSPGEAFHLLFRAKQPVARISWNEANAFCTWLSKKTGRKFVLPTKEQWQYAAAAGMKTPFWFGTFNANFTLKENLGDALFASINDFSWRDRVNVLPVWRPAALDQNDRSRVSAPIGSYQSSPWKLYDILGNVAEWTASDSVDPQGEVKKIICGGSWATPPERATYTSTRRYHPWMAGFDVGFRVMCVE